MDDLDLRMRTALADLQAELARRPVPEAPERTRTSWRRISLAFVGVVATIAVMIWLTGPTIPSVTTDDGPLTHPPVAPSTTTTLQVSIPVAGPLFGEETGVVLLFDDGYYGLMALDPDRRLAQAHAIPGQRPGDERFSMARVGDHLVVGWGEPHAVEIASLDGLSLGSARIFLPGPDPDRVWLINDPGGSETTAWQVSVTGEQLTAPNRVDAEGYPAIGIPGGLALGHDLGMTLWDSASGELRRLTASGYGQTRFVTVDELGWCAGECGELLITDLETTETIRFRVPAGYTRVLERGVSAAPIGSPQEGRLAALVGSPDAQALWLLDPATGAETVVGLSGPAFELAWSPDGSQVFISNWSFGANQTRLWRYDLAEQLLREAVLPFGGAMSMVVIETDEADVYFQGQPACPQDARPGAHGCLSDF